MLKLKKAQITMEYAIMAICFVAALLSMQVYLKRSIQGRLRLNADSIGEQFDPRSTTLDITTTFSSDVQTNVLSTEQNGVTTTNSYSRGLAPELTTRNGTENVGALGNSLN